MSVLTKVIDVGHSNDLIIVTFGGYANKFGGIPPFEFLNFLKNNFPNTDKQFYIDIHSCCYAKGIAGITNNIKETVDHLSQQIKGYKKAVFVGTSGGGYAAILFGSLLNIDTVIAFIPTTIVRKANVESNYKNLSTVINQTTKYYLYADTKIKDNMDSHHISHCENVAIYPNVVIHKLFDVKLKEMRNSGELLKIFNKHIFD
jgi:hypothetical protein